MKTLFRVMISITLISGLAFSGLAGAAPYFKQRTILKTAADTNIIIERTEERYDTRGNLVESARYDPSGKLFVKNVWNYGKDKRLVSESRYDCNGSVCYVETYNYDDKGNVADQERQMAGFPLGLISFQDEEATASRPGASAGSSRTNRVFLRYNNSGLLLAQKKVDCTGSMCQVINFFYDKRNRQVDQDYYDSNNVLLKRVSSAYDANGRVTGYSAYDPSGNLSEQSTFTYDPDGRILTKQDYDTATGLPANLTRNTWDNGLLLVAETTDNQGQVVATTEYLYDSWGRISQERKFRYDNSPDPAVKLLSQVVSYTYK